MTTLDERRPGINGVQPLVSYRARRRRPDLFEHVLGLLIGGSLVVSLLLLIALTFGSVWLIVVVLQDLMRRLGG